jgi:NAD(P)-dependent dehydrogenase (short-subunit alcohol dehydrogenase family)
MNKLDLDGRNAVVTGGASGLGFAIAARLITSGAKVVIWYRLKKCPFYGRFYVPRY